MIKRKRRTKSEMAKQRASTEDKPRGEYENLNIYNHALWNIGPHRDKQPVDIPTSYLDEFIKWYKSIKILSTQKLFRDRYEVAKLEINRRNRRKPIRTNRERNELVNT